MNTQNITPEVSSAVAVEWIKQDLGFDMDRIMVNADPLIIRWIFYVNNELGIPIHYEIRQDSISITDCQVAKPCDYIKLIKLTIGECCTVPTYTTPAKNLQKCNTDHHCIERGRTFYYGNYTVVETPHFFNLSGNAEGCDLNIEYKAYNFDENGYPIVDLTYREAITAFIRWKFIIRMRGIGMGARAGFTAGDEQQAKRDYAAFAGLNRARKRMDALNEDMLNQITSKWSDPFYVPENPYVRRIAQHNTAHIHGRIY